MGTRALINIFEDDNVNPFVTIYRQFDGYPDGLGRDIKEALGKRKPVNGFTDAKIQVNGMGCAAALLVAHLKKDMEAGNTYLQMPGVNDVGEEFIYNLHLKAGELHVDVMGSDKYMFYSGSINEFDPDKYSDC